MGCITSRGDNWPPKPYKRVIIREKLEERVEGGEIKKVSAPVEDYVWVYPGEWHGGGSGVAARWDEEAGPGQENAIRNLEDN
jgi:hypothetical protein